MRVITADSGPAGWPSRPAVPGIGRDTTHPGSGEKTMSVVRTNDQLYKAKAKHYETQIRCSAT